MAHGPRDIYSERCKTRGAPLLESWPFQCTAPALLWTCTILITFVTVDAEDPPILAASLDPFVAVFVQGRKVLPEFAVCLSDNAQLRDSREFHREVL